MSFTSLSYQFFFRNSFVSSIIQSPNLLNFGFEFLPLFFLMTNRRSLLSRIRNKALSPSKRYPTPSSHAAAWGPSESTPLGSSRREQASFEIDHSQSSKEEEVMQEEETFSSPAGNTRSRKSSKSFARKFLRNKADITWGKKPVGRRLELVN